MDLTAKIAIIGGGRRCILILAALHGEEHIEIVGISDINPSAPAAPLASELGIFFTADFHELLNNNEINFVINATDDKDISKELEAIRERGISVIDGKVSEFFLDILDRIKRDKANLQHNFDRQKGHYESLESSKDFLTKVLNTSADMIVVADREGHITECNAAVEKMLGYKKEEFLDTRASDYWHSPEERKSVAERLKREGSITNYETRLRKKDGSHLDISLSISLLKNDSGDVAGTVGVSKDITEKKRYEEELLTLNEHLEERVFERTKELESANKELERSSKLKSQFIANMSHELRTPLNSIIGFSETLLEMPVGDLNERQERYTRRIHTSGKHLLQLINNLLDLAKIESGRFTAMYDEFNLQPVIEEIISIVEPLYSKKEIALRHNLDENITTIMADRVKFKQILYNLLSNAIKFTPDKGDVCLEARLLPAEESATYGFKMSDRTLMKVSVSDTGIGIKHEDLDRIFNEFEQADSSYTRKYEGTGIGLSLTKKLVEMHGGVIWVESTEGRGSTFSFIMPVLQTRPGTVLDNEEISGMQELVVSSPVEEGCANTILVVEDDHSTSEILTIFLKNAGYSVAHAYDGIEAVKKAAMLNPFAIILDVMIPHKDGWEVLQEMRTLPETRDIPVIIYSVIDNKELGFALGATDYLTKPVDKDTLIKKLYELSFSKKKARKIINVMVVDDNPDVVELLASMLEEEGFNVIKAFGGREAIEKAESMRLDVIFLDLMMPDLDGFEVVQKLKNIPATRDIPIFVVTAKDITMEERLLLAGQIERIYQKTSFSKEDLIEQIKSLELMYPAKAGLIDETSKLFNYAYFQLRLAQEIKRAERYNEAISLLKIDIDKFGLYIKEQGVYHGDVVIRKIAEILRKGLRGSDIISRIGHDEFAVILTRTLKSPAAATAKRFKALIEAYPFFGSEALPDGKLTLSMGIAVYPEDAGDVEGLISMTNTALRKAKESGGNRLTVV